VRSGCDSSHYSSFNGNSADAERSGTRVSPARERLAL
jgi:hypothetical protein